jgi:hypothetical protein
MLVYRALQSAGPQARVPASRVYGIVRARVDAALRHETASARPTSEEVAVLGALDGVELEGSAADALGNLRRWAAEADE